MKWKRLLMGLALALWCSLTISAPAQTNKENEEAQYAAAGQQALSEGRYVDAQSDFERLAKLAPDVAEVHATLAVVYYRQQEFELAVREIRTAQKLKTGLPHLENLLGLSLAELSRPAEALPHLEKCFNDSTDNEARRLCGLELLRTYTGLGRDPEGVETALMLNKAYPDDPEVLYHTGRIYGNFAYVVMERLHDKAPNSIWMLQAQGEANESQKDFDAAIVAFNHVLLIEPRRPGIHYRLGRVYLARFHETQRPEDQGAAAREFSAELAIDPANGNAAYELANFNASHGNLDDAIKLYQAVLKRYPDFQEALVGLAGIEIANQKPADAVPLLERATRLRPEDEVAWYRLAQADSATRDTAGRAKALEAFTRLHSSTPVTLRRPDEDDEITPQHIDMEAKP
jgi:tetratricopeptide (TPR) repeat protein